LKETTNMKLLLTKDIAELGIVGDVVEVSAGYARNYLLPQHLAIEPTEANFRALAEERRKAEERRRTLREAKLALAEQLKEVEVTIAAAANPDGVLYGSVGPREISAALKEEGYNIEPGEVNLHTPIRRLDNVQVEIRLGDEINSEVKVWVVRSRGSEAFEEEEGETTETEAGTEAGEDGDSADDT
jgi:large subunit ribosomal protein L9